jgi:hypothetical protein
VPKTAKNWTKTVIFNTTEPEMAYTSTNILIMTQNLAMSSGFTPVMANRHTHLANSYLEPSEKLLTIFESSYHSLWLENLVSQLINAN